MTMEKPRPWIVRPKGYREIPSPWKQRHVASRWIVELEGFGRFEIIVGFGALSKESKIVPVHCLVMEKPFSSCIQHSKEQGNSG